MTKTFFIKTYGCQMNLYDEGIVREILKREGYKPGKEEEAQLFLILTCAVRKHAERRALGFLSSIQKLKKERPERKIGVLGCLAKALGEKILSLGADFVLGPDNYQKLPEMIKDSVIGVETTDSSTETYEEYPPEPKGVSAFLAIMRGCDNFCSYCIVPYCRGRERSKKFLKVLAEA
ncbi:MAG: tRNA (N6-isopentenyl adenosine(37)-C2)-methylthiotransferase MiaB, partial [candidate division WOR-3 bacterium]